MQPEGASDERRGVGATASAGAAQGVPDPAGEPAQPAGAAATASPGAQAPPAAGSDSERPPA
eukprot:11164274-Lingulodinium_polyedra.AAC.1